MIRPVVNFYYDSIILGLFTCLLSLRHIYNCPLKTSFSSSQPCFLGGIFTHSLGICSEAQCKDVSPFFSCILCANLKDTRASCAVCTFLSARYNVLPLSFSTCLSPASFSCYYISFVFAFLHFHFFSSFSLFSNIRLVFCFRTLTIVTIVKVSVYLDQLAYFVCTTDSLVHQHGEELLDWLLQWQHRSAPLAVLETPPAQLPQFVASHGSSLT